MELLVTDEGKKVSGVEIQVFRNGSLKETVLTDGQGRADIPMDPNGDYMIEVGGNKQLIQKKISVSTKGVPPGTAKGDNFYPAEVELFKELDGMNLDILNKPVGKIFYDPESGEFGADRKYTQEVQKKLEDLKDEYLAQKEADEEKQKQKKKEYDAVIKEADKAFGDEKWAEARDLYQKASKLMPMETYPSFQLAELETKMIKINETQEKYDKAIAKAEAAEASNDLEIAIAEYKRAGGYKPDEELPKQKVEQLQDRLEKQAKAQQIYMAAIEKGDNALKVNDLESAKAAFQEATEAKPDEVYPKNKLAEINDIISKKQAKEEQYNLAIANGDQAVKDKDYQKAKDEFQKAASLKPTESYPKEQLVKMDELLAEQAKREQEYLAAIEKGDNALTKNQFSEAQDAFKNASSIKPGESYPKDKLKEIESLLAEQQAKEEKYQEKIQAADAAMTEKNYEAAKKNYQAAAEIKPKESYPSEKISEIERILAELALKEEQYKEAINKGDQALGNDDYDKAKKAFEEALALKADEQYPKDKLAEIEKIVLKNQQLKADYQKAIQDGDDAFAAKDYDKAVEFYQEALTLKADEPYPKDQLAEVEKAIAAQKELEQKYAAAIQKGDDAFKNKALEEAQQAYTDAIELKPNETYPAEQLTKVEAELAAAKKLEEDYQNAIQEGDDALASLNYGQAKIAYEKALDLKADEAYPKEKLTEINAILEEQAKQEEAYNQKIAEADEAFNQENWKNAKAAYQAALEIKNDESYPVERIDQIDQTLAEIAKREEAAAKLEADYQAAIAKGDQKLEDGLLDEALTAFQEALELKPEEEYPAGKISEIKAEQDRIVKEKAEAERLAALEKEYQELIAKADKLFKSEELKQARETYQEALSLKSDEKYPKEQITVINDQLADAKEQEELYATKLSEADQLFEEKNYEDAKIKYNEALSIKSDEQYPKDQLAAIDKELEALAAKQEEIRLQEEKEAEKQARYEAFIAKADEFFEAENYQEAKLNYESALGVKEDAYPVEQIQKIEAIFEDLAAKKEAEAKAAEQAKIDQQYQLAIAEADQALEEKAYDLAKEKYKQALSLKSEESYPAKKLEEIDALLESLEEKKARQKAEAEAEKNYLNAITLADEHFQAGKLEKAKAAYEEALSYKDEQYPKDQLVQVEKALEEKQRREAILAKQAKLDQQYISTIQDADEKFTNQEFEDALGLYKEAAELKPNENYPVDKINQINEILEDQKISVDAQKAIIESKYIESITLADMAMEDKDYIDAKEYYKNATALKPKEPYPKEMLEKIKQLENAKENAAKNDNAYQTAIVAGDKMYSQKNYNEAENEYRLALSLKPEEVYPQQQLDKIAEHRARKKTAQNKEQNYQNAIAEADEAFEQERYQKAKERYQAALKIKADQSHPKSRIEEINQILKEQRLAEEERKKKLDQPIAIQKGPRQTITDDAEKEIEAMYEEMAAKRRLEKKEFVENKQNKFKTIQKEQREEELKNRKNAIERISQISISIKEQQEKSDQVYAQNHEKVKEKEKQLSKQRKKLATESERKRNDAYSEAEQLEKKNQLFRKERNQEISHSKKPLVEEKYQEQKEIIQTYNENQKERIEQANQDYVLKEKTIREYNQELTKANAEENKGLLEEKTKALREAEQYRVSKSQQKIGQEQEKINQQKLEAIQFNSSRKDHYKEGQAQVEEKTKSLKNKQKSLDTEAQKRRQENADREFYEGEDLPREDQAAAEYPQGVTEEIIENKNNSTTIRRIVVNGTEVDIYEKTLYPYGGTFYTKNGTNITEEMWDAESR